MGGSEGDAAEGEPVVAFGHEQYIAKPARDESEEQMVLDAAVSLGSGHIEQDEKDEQEGFGLFAGCRVIFPAVEKVDAGEYEEQDQECISCNGHRVPSFCKAKLVRTTVFYHTYTVLVNC